MRMLNNYGLTQLAARMREIAGFDPGDSDADILDAVSSMGGRGSACGMIRLEMDGEVEVPSHLTRSGNPYLLRAEANWFSGGGAA